MGTGLEAVAGKACGVSDRFPTFLITKHPELRVRSSLKHPSFSSSYQDLDQTLTGKIMPDNALVHHIHRWTGMSTWSATLQALATLLLSYLIMRLIQMLLPDYPTSKITKLQSHERRLHALEGLLRRLVLTPHRESLVLRGSLLLRGYCPRTPRIPEDLDFLALHANDEELSLSVIRQVCARRLDDGIEFDDEGVTVRQPPSAAIIRRLGQSERSAAVGRRLVRGLRRSIPASRSRCHTGCLTTRRGHTARSTSAGVIRSVRRQRWRCWRRRLARRCA